MEKFEELYQSACGIIGVNSFSDSDDETFEGVVQELEDNPDFSFIGQFDSTQDADEELQYQGLTLDQITKMSMSHYGNVIEALESPQGDYWVFLGAR